MSLYPTEADVKHRLRRAALAEDAKPLAFVVGAGASGSVPSTEKMVSIFRKTLGSDIEDQTDFDEAVADRTGAEKYGVAARFIIDRAGIDVLNRAVRIAVLSARVPATPNIDPKLLQDETRLLALEQDAKGWAIPRGLNSLAQFIAFLPGTSRGPIITTNFDPLIEIALRLHGLTPLTVILDGESSPGIPPSGSEVVPVLHVHGYWRLSDTLHTPAQLDRPRPRLKGGLQSVLTRSLATVIGYSGWDDVFTSALGDLIAQGAERDLEIIWCSYGREPEMGVLSGQAVPGRLQPFVNVDSNTMFPSVVEAIEERLTIRMPKSRRVEESLVTPRGLIRLDGKFLQRETVRSQSHQGAISFFDGREPTWSDIARGLTANLTWVEALKNKIQNRGTRQAPHFLVEGPTGEGKSTGLMHVAWKLAQDGDFEILYSDGSELWPEEVLRQQPSGRYSVLFVDNADLRIREVGEIINGLTVSGRTDVTCVLASRDTDWRRAIDLSGARRMIGEVTNVPVLGLTLTDAEKIVHIWERQGGDALGHLKSVRTDERAIALRHAAQGIGAPSLLGALLSARHGEGLVMHIRELLTRLERIPLPNGKSLLYAYEVICVASARKIGPLAIGRLAEVLSLTERETVELVVKRLGREAATQRHGDDISPRHPLIASIAVEIAPDFGYNAREVLEDTIGAVVSAGRGSAWSSDIVRIAYAAQRMADDEDQVAAAAAARRGDPRQLRLRCAEMGILRTTGRRRDALDAAKDAWANLSGLTDTRLALRAYLREYARIVGQMGDSADAAALHAVSILDLEEADPVDPLGAGRALNGLSHSFGAWDGSAPPDLIVWQGCTAEWAHSLVHADSELTRQAAKYLAEAKRAGYVPQDSAAKDQRALLANLIKYSLNHSQLPPVTRFRARQGFISQVIHLLGL